MGGERGASVVEYLLVVCAVALVLMVVVGRFPAGFGGGPGGALSGDPATTTTTATVLGATALQGGSGAVLWAPAESAAGEPLLITTRPGAGVVLLDAGRRLLDEVAVEAVAGIDVRTGVGPGPDAGDLVVVGERSALRAFRLDAPAYRLEPLGEPWPAGLEVAGLCLHRPPGSGTVGVFVFDAGGRMVHWELDTAGEDRTVRRLRSLSFDTPVAACTVDDANGNLFVSELEHGLWRYPVMEPGQPGTLVDRVGDGGGLVAGADALAVIDAPAGPGWILASSESDEAYSFYRRDAGHAPAGRFPAGARVDRCQDVASLHAAGGFLVCQSPERTELVPLTDITRLPTS